MAQQTSRKAPWDVEELRLLETGWAPTWDDEDERLVQTLTCTLDGRTLCYVGLARGAIAVVFGICPSCQSWVSFKGARQ